MGDTSRDTVISSGDVEDSGSASVAWFEGELVLKDVLAGCDQELQPSSYSYSCFSSYSDSNSYSCSYSCSYSYSCSCSYSYS